MAFIAYQRQLRNALNEGQVSISGGAMHVRVSDLKRAGITTELTLLMDAEGRKLALRRPREGEPAIDLRPVWKTGKPRRSVQFCVKGVLQAIGVDPEAAAGRHDVVVKDDMVIVSFAAAKRKGT